MTSAAQTWSVLKSTVDGSLKIIYKGKIINTETVDFAYVQKPFPNEHAARQSPPGKFTSFRRGKLPGAPAGISVIFGIRNVGGKKVSEIQSLRFDAKLWTPAKAKKWLKDHGFKTGGFEKATGKPKGVKKMSTESVERKTHDVLVHKVAVPLMKDESLSAFTKELKASARIHIMQKFNIDEKNGTVFPVEIFATKAVFMVIPDFDKPPSNDFHIAIKFTRSLTTGQFNFTDSMKVKPVTSFVNAEGITAAKVAKAEVADEPETESETESEPETEMEPETDTETETVVEVIKAMGMDAWTPASSVFIGVI